MPMLALTIVDSLSTIHRALFGGGQKNALIIVDMLSTIIRASKPEQNFLAKNHPKTAQNLVVKHVKKIQSRRRAFLFTVTGKSGVITMYGLYTDYTHNFTSNS